LGRIKIHNTGRPIILDAKNVIANSMLMSAVAAVKRMHPAIIQ
jgi:hypothetical protein